MRFPLWPLLASLLGLFAVVFDIRAAALGIFEGQSDVGTPKRAGAAEFDTTRAGDPTRHITSSYSLNRVGGNGCITANSAASFSRAVGRLMAVFSALFVTLPVA